jgi:glycosyltransferase involved in cell wall biosynthesis
MISVIIPVYNGDQHIERICRLFAKQLHADFELIFVNDGSTDQTLGQMLLWQSEAHLQIKVIDQANQGVSAARNAGIDAASGEFLCFCDVDDIPLPAYLSDMLSVLMNERVDLVFCQHQTVSFASCSAAPRGESGRIRRASKLECLRDFLYGRLVSGCWTLMIREDVLTENQLRFAEGYKYSEDLHFVWRAIAGSQDIAYLERTLYLYVLQPGSATSRFTEERFHGYELIKGLETHFDKKVPVFANEYRRFAAAKMAWSLAWQSAVHNSADDYLKVVREHEMKGDILHLITFPDPKVAASSLIFILSPRLFRRLARAFGTGAIDRRQKGKARGQ